MTEGAVTQCWSDLRCQAECGNSCLVTIYPADALGGLIELGHGTLTIGRSAACQVQLNNDSVSRRHAQISRSGNEYVLRDLESTNGTFVNDLRIHTTSLVAGDRIHIGNHILKFLSSNDIEAQYHETVFKMVTTDGLTDCYNKRYLLDALEREIGRAQRFGRSLAVLVMDIDHFKTVNDTHGHLVGDAVLLEFCRRVRANVRLDEIFARYGGDEFVLVACETSPEEAAQIAERIRLAISERPIITEADAIDLTVSIGVACYLGGRVSPEQLIQQADENLYRAKHAGRNCASTA